MSDDRRQNPRLLLGTSISRWLLAAIVTFWVFLGTAFALCQLDLWAFPDLLGGDFFACICLATFTWIISGCFVARWTRGGGKPPRLLTLAAAYTLMLVGAALMLLEIGARLSQRPVSFELGPFSLLGLCLIVGGLMLIVAT